jgi:hypothetical protein
LARSRRHHRAEAATVAAQICVRHLLVESVAIRVTTRRKILETWVYELHRLHERALEIDVVAPPNLQSRREHQATRNR